MFATFFLLLKIWSNTTEVGEKLHEGRSKRGALHLYSMIKCATGCDPIIFKGYGCYCGFLWVFYFRLVFQDLQIFIYILRGSGRALDGIDRCCKMHDYCYTVSGCPMFLEYFVPYLWKCYRGQALCALDHGEWGGPHSCASRLCKCDLALSKCMRRYHCPKKRPVCTSSPFRLLQNLVMVFWGNQYY